MGYETIKVDTVDGVTTIMFNRPDRRNAMNPTLHLEMVDALTDLEFDDDCRVLVLTGAGESFCAGQDLKEYFYDISDDRKARAKARKASSLWRTQLLRLFPKPTISAVNGYCFGGAFSIVGNSDIVVAGSNARFGLSEVNFGKIAGGHVSKVVSQAINRRDAIYYLMTGQLFGAEEAVRIGLATMHVPQEELMSKVDEIAGMLKEKNPRVLQSTKEALLHVEDMNWEAAGAWLTAKSNELDYLSGETWKKGVEQFKAHKFRPGLGDYDWKEASKE